MVVVKDPSPPQGENKLPDIDMESKNGMNLDDFELDFMRRFFIIQYLGMEKFL